MSDQGEQTPERLEMVAGSLMEDIGLLEVCHIDDLPAIEQAIVSALRSAEARGRVQGLREAADLAVSASELAHEVLASKQNVGNYLKSLARDVLREVERADAIEQEKDESLLGGTGPNNSGEGAPVAAWLPIETAPNDGTMVLLCVAGYPETIHMARRFRVDVTDPHNAWRPYVPNEWTHWMPLPAPPIKQEQPKS